MHLHSYSTLPGISWQPSVGDRYADSGCVCEPDAVYIVSEVHSMWHSWVGLSSLSLYLALCQNRLSLIVEFFARLVTLICKVKTRDSGTVQFGWPARPVSFYWATVELRTKSVLGYTVYICDMKIFTGREGRAGMQLVPVGAFFLSGNVRDSI